MTVILVCGGRDYDDWIKVKRTLDVYHLQHRVTGVVHGDAGKVDENGVVLCGADKFAGAWAQERGIPEYPFPVSKADWKALGLSAGPKRNARMLKEKRPDVVIAFPGGRGTTDMITKAFDAGIKIEQVK